MMGQREAVVLAGGFGTRLRSVVPDLPKPMAPVAGRPFLEILLESLAAKGFGRAVLSLGHQAEVVMKHFSRRFAGIEIEFCVEDNPLGTGGAIKLALAHCVGDHAFVVNGDTYLDFEADNVDALWQAHGQPVIVARTVADTARYGRIVVADDLLLNFGDKAASGPGLINAGCYVLPRALLAQRDRDVAFSFENDFLADPAARPAMRVFVTQGRFIDIGVPRDYARAQHELSFAAPS